MDSEIGRLRGEGRDEESRRIRMAWACDEGGGHVIADGDMACDGSCGRVCFYFCDLIYVIISN